MVDPYRREALRAETRARRPRAEMGFPTADQGLSSIQGTLFRFCGIKIVFDACNIYLHQAWTDANDKITVKDYIAIDSTQHSGGSQPKRCRV